MRCVASLDSRLSVVQYYSSLSVGRSVAAVVSGKQVVCRVRSTIIIVLLLYYYYYVIILIISTYNYHYYYIFIIVVCVFSLSGRRCAPVSTRAVLAQNYVRLPVEYRVISLSSVHSDCSVV